jgi:membrane dipeptidase
MELKLIDLHSDTASELYYKKKDLKTNDLHVSLDKAERYASYAQVFAVFTRPRFSDEEGYAAFLQIADTLDSALERYHDSIVPVRNGRDLQEAWRSGKAGAILAVEDSRLLCGKIERVQALYDRGVRFMTLTWAGETCIGGSWDTESGLTDFGKAAVHEAFRVGITPDVSHASFAQIDDVLEIASAMHKPIVATHSNSYAVYPHRRNLSDRHFEAIRDLGGITGMNMYKDHLTDTKISPATIDTVCTHIEHFMALGGENTVCFGCDFDGATFPADLRDLSDIAKIADALLQKNYSEELVQKIFWKNAERFMMKHL